ncbi:hypothetical protein M569_16813, partial [Genlisea aurea]
SQAVRVNFFCGFKFSLAWWAYAFPMTGAAIAAMRYADAVNTLEAKALALTLCVVATLTMSVLLVTTIVHVFVLRDLFPNDNAIAISERKPKKMMMMRWHPGKSAGSEQYLKFTDSPGKRD